MSKKRISFFAFSLSLFVVLTYQSVKANVGLVSFTATPQENTILLEWVTESELDNAGFIIQRSEHQVLDFQGLPDPDNPEFILARGSGGGTVEYEFLDEDALLEEGITYYYQLQAWDINNNYETFGPVSAILGATPTSTATATATETITPTVTNTDDPNRTATKTRTPTITRTPTKTRTPGPTRTYTPAPPTFTPTQITNTPTITPTATITPSPTLNAPPEIVLNLPVTETSFPTRVPTATSQPAPTPTQVPESFLTKMIESGSLLTISAICLVVFLWAAIAVGIFIYLQKRNS